MTAGAVRGPAAVVSDGWCRVALAGRSTVVAAPVVEGLVAAPVAGVAAIVPTPTRRAGR